MAHFVVHFLFRGCLIVPRPHVFADISIFLSKNNEFPLKLVPRLRSSNKGVAFKIFEFCFLLWLDKRILNVNYSKLCLMLCVIWYSRQLY